MAVYKAPGETVSADIQIKNIGNIDFGFVSSIILGGSLINRKNIFIKRGQIGSHSVSFSAPYSPGTYPLYAIVSDNGREFDRKSDTIIVKEEIHTITFTAKNSKTNTPIPSVDFYFDGRHFVTNIYGVGIIETTDNIETITWDEPGYQKLTVTYDTSYDRSYTVYLVPIRAAEIVNMTYPFWTIRPGELFTVGIEVKNNGASQTFDVRLKIKGLVSWLWHTSISAGQTKTFTQTYLAPQVSGMYNLEGEVWADATLLDSRVIPGAIVISL